MNFVDGRGCGYESLLQMPCALISWAAFPGVISSTDKLERKQLSAFFFGPSVSGAAHARPGGRARYLSMNGKLHDLALCSRDWRYLFSLAITSVYLIPKQDTPGARCGLRSTRGEAKVRYATTIS
jgi:hypothetical protein